MQFPPDKLGATQVMLDGQQRLTTLYLLLTNYIPPYYRIEDIKNDPRDLYFDLESGDFQYYQVTRMKNNPTWVPVTACFDMSNMVEVFDVVQKKFTSTSNIKEQYQYAELYTKNITQLRNILDKDYPVQIVPDSAIELNVSRCWKAGRNSKKSLIIL